MEGYSCVPAILIGIGQQDWRPDMPPKAATTQNGLAQERRTNRRLRTIVGNMRAEMESMREQMEGIGKVVEMNVARLAQLQAEIDRLKADVARLLR
jgi:hypothetical protein